LGFLDFENPVFRSGIVFILSTSWKFLNVALRLFYFFKVLRLLVLKRFAFLFFQAEFNEYRRF
jgi:hypothetical protein